MPLKGIGYQGPEFEEMDLEALIARRPERVLVDELAHTNAPGSRHPEEGHRRLEQLPLHLYLDDRDRLRQQLHIESLNDVVAQITSSAWWPKNCSPDPASTTAPIRISSRSTRHADDLISV